MTAKELELEQLRTKGTELQRVRQLFFGTYIRDNQKRLEANFGNKNDVCVRFETLQSELMWAYEGGYAAARADVTKAQAERDALRERIGEARNILKQVYNRFPPVSHEVGLGPAQLDLATVLLLLTQSALEPGDALAQRRSEDEAKARAFQEAAATCHELVALSDPDTDERAGLKKAAHAIEALAQHRGEAKRGADES